MKKISVIAAVSQNGVYGEGGLIPWQIPEDLAHFKKRTLERTVVMGRRTWDSLPPAFRPLPGRQNIVISANKSFVAPGALAVSSFEDALVSSVTDDVFFIGGGEVWREAMPFAQEVWLTVVKKEYPITPNFTCVARHFLRFDEYWPEFQLQSNESYVSGGKQALPFEIRHWVRGL